MTPLARPTPDLSYRTSVFDANDNLLSLQQADDCDGTPDSLCSQSTYDDTGNQLTLRGGDDCDGVPEERESYLHQ